MAEMNLIPQADYIDACNAIREKDGSTAVIKSGEMGAKIRALSGLDSLVDKSITEAELKTAEVGDYAFYNCTKLWEVMRKENEGYSSFKSIGNYAFAGCSNLTTFYSDGIEIIGEYAFRDALNNRDVWVDLNALTNIGEGAFYSAGIGFVDAPLLTMVSTEAFSYSQLKEIYLKSVTSISNKAFESCFKLKLVDIGANTDISVSAFMDCHVLDTLILRNTSGVCKLLNQDAFYGTPIFQGTGYIYVPKALIEQYKVAAEWSRYATQFRAIEDYPDIVGA